MQYILTEEEYLKLSRQFEYEKEKYVKRIDVSLALKDLIQDIHAAYPDIFGYGSFRYNENNWTTIMEKFSERIKNV